MPAAFGGLHITGGTTNVRVLSTGTELSGVLVTWAAIAATTHGDASVSGSTSTGRLTLNAGIYKVDLDISLENNTVSGLSSEDVTVQDVIIAALAKGSATFPTAIAGTKTKTMVMEGLPTSLHVSAIVEVSKADVDSGYNYVSALLSTNLAGGSSSDVLITEARLLATKLDA